MRRVIFIYISMYRNLASLGKMTYFSKNKRKTLKDDEHDFLSGADLKGICLMFFQMHLIFTSIHDVRPRTPFNVDLRPRTLNNVEMKNHQNPQQETASVQTTLYGVGGR